MESMHVLLRQAEGEWRSQVKRDFPLRGDTKVITSGEKAGHRESRDWSFFTDLKDIYALVFSDDALRRKFTEIIPVYWDGEPEDLARDTLHYLLFHELYHPIEAPFSVSGEDNDNKKIHQAIRRGLLTAQPELSPLEQVVKVQASQNGVKDFILDNRFYLDNQEKDYVREDVIPMWDVLELQDAPSKTNFYTVTRFLYGVLYGPASTHGFFEGKAGKDGVAVAQKALGALLGKSVKLPRHKKGLVEKVKSLFSATEDPAELLSEYIASIRQVFSGEDRYEGIERFMGVLGPYVEQGMPQGRPDMQGEGAGTSPQSILQDLLDDMSSEEQQQFLQTLAQEDPSALEQAASQMQSSLQDDSRPNDTRSADEMKNLDVLAMHEFYKRNHPTVKIIGGKKVGESVVVGKQQYWDLKRSSVLTEDQLARVNLQRIDALQRRTRLPWLMDLGNGTYRLNEYELKQRDVKDVVYVDAHLDVPDVVEFYLDSSGSMGSGNFVPNDGSRWDMLSHVLYGFIDALKQGGKQIGKQSKMRIHNFANKQISSDIIPVDQFWRGDASPLGVLFKPRNGYSVEDIDITHYRDGRKRAYVVVTDGDLVIGGRTAREARKMKEIGRAPNNTVVLFEIGGSYDLGRAVRSDPNIVYHQVHDKDRMLQAGLEVLLSRRSEIGDFWRAENRRFSS